MKRVRNATHQPIRVPLAGDKVLHLGPDKEGQVGEESMDRPAFRKLVDAGILEIVGQGTADETARAAGPHVREATHGHHHPTVVKPKGDR